MAIDKDTIQSLNDKMRERYNARIDAEGFGAFALGWGERRFQEHRFDMVLHALDPQRDIVDRRVLDVGCGLGDFLAHCQARGLEPANYLGYDINTRFLEEARKRYPDAQFEERDLLLAPTPEPVAETGVVVGVLNLKHPDPWAYTQAMMEACWAAVSDVLLVNVISDVHNSDYPREDFIHYHDPGETLRLAQRLTPYCSLVQDFAGEPQWEFMLVMRREPWQPGQPLRSERGRDD